ncbi:MAG: hypothetical protein F6K35_49065 [Okeania sp. SIO2H7]|nr:hypothetical protein [Okeania sp. SIO2H7]
MLNSLFDALDVISRLKTGFPGKKMHWPTANAELDKAAAGVDKKMVQNIFQTC